MKKRQKDFDKVPLRVGKTLPKKKNETNTTIKKRKLQMPNQKLVKKSALSCEEFVKSICQRSVQEDDLKHLKDMIQKQQSKFSQFLQDIFHKMSKIIIDNNLTKSLRDNALKVLLTLLELTDDSKLSCFMPYFINVISCLISHSNEEIKSISLELIDTLLERHPNLICCSKVTFDELLTFLSVQMKKSPTIRTRQTDYNVADAASSKIVKILDRLNKFLIVILENEVQKEDGEKDVEVYWDCKSPLYLELFAGGGLKPFDIEKFYSSNFNSGRNDFKDPVKIKRSLEQFMPVCSEIFIEFSEDSSSASDALVSNHTIKKLGVLFDLLSNFGEWVKLLANSEVGDYFAMVFSKDMLKHLVKFPFSPREASIMLKKQEKRLPSVRLNLAICYLYSTFILNTDYCTGMLKSQVFDYLVSVQNMSNDIQIAVIPIMLKITKNYLQLTDAVTVTEYVDKILPGICDLFGTNDSGNEKMLASFLIEVSLKPEYSSLMESVAMKVWFSELLSYFVRMASKGSVDKHLLNSIKKIANRKHQQFLDSLEEMSVQEIIELFKHSSEDVRDTVNFLICNMEKIPVELYQELSDAILTDTDFPIKTAVRLIRLLTYRLSKEDVDSEDRVHFVQFLLNLAIDFSNGQEGGNLIECCPTNYIEAFLPCDGFFNYNFIPTLRWKRHSELFEVCLSSFAQFPSLTVGTGIFAIIQEMVQGENKVIPVHSAIAMLRLYFQFYRTIKYDKSDKEKVKSKHNALKYIMQDIVYCSLVFISIFTTLKFDDDWYYNNVVELMNSLQISESLAVKLLEQMRYDAENTKDGIIGHYMLRVARFLLNRQLLPEDEIEEILKILEILKEKCQHENFEQQPLFINLMHQINIYYYR